MPSSKRLLHGLPVAYRTGLGEQVVGDSLRMLAELPKESVDLIVTSPPFALLRKKEYGNESQEAYVQWLSEFGALAKPALRDSGSFVIDLGGAYRKGAPVRSLYNYRVLLDFVDNLGYHLAEEFFWFNPAKLPSPTEWVNKRKIRATDAVNTIWWLSKTEWPKADVRRVLRPYSASMAKLLEDPEKYYETGERPSEHVISRGFGSNNGGAIPKNLLQISNTESNTRYMRTCKALGQKTHPARFPSGLPEFFIAFLTDPGDVVLDIFSGSNTTGAAAQGLGRRWLSCEMSSDYAHLSIARFEEAGEASAVQEKIAKMQAGHSVTLRSTAARVGRSGP